MRPILAAVILLLLSTYAAADSGSPQSAYLDVEERFYIEWQYTDTNITILARVKTTGWFGIGFSPNGGMAGADIITASVVNGKPSLQDRYAEKNGYPVEDSSQDVQLLSGSEVNGVTTIKFTRKHNTCDDKDMVVGTDTMRMIYAISADGKDSLSYHTPFSRGTRSIYLRQQFTLIPTIPDDAITVDIAVKNVEVPAFHTEYYCEVMRSPKFDTKHHLILVEPLIEEANLGLVHHVVLYGCYEGVDLEHHFKNNKTGFSCLNHANMPADVRNCRASSIFAWGVGGGPTYFPEEAGYPLGGDNYPDYFMIEMHYDNPKLLSGIRDSSGFRMTLTPTLRKFDAATLSVGAVQGIAIPPEVKDFVSSGFCSSKCSEDNLENDLNVFGSFLHGHLAATQIVARHFRDGEELDVLDEDRHYDFNYQQYKILEKPVKFKPRDSMVVQCHYNTEGRTKMTYGDLPSSSEMCIAYLYYYPASRMEFCVSQPVWADYQVNTTTDFVNNYLGFKSANVSNDFKQAFDQIHDANMWTRKRVKKLEDAYLSMPQLNVCQKRSRTQTSSKLKFETSLPPKECLQPVPKRSYEKGCVV